MKKAHIDSHPALKYRLCRRSFLKAGALALGGCIFPQALLGAVQGSPSPERSLSLYNLHTGECLRTAYWFRGEYLSEALSAKWADVDMEKRSFTIRASNSKSKRLRAIPLSDTAMEVPGHGCGHQAA
ncbi:MAG: hypothetical protein MUD15_13955 [Desulfobacterota bacterium]|nr:hypothetical protein [Thermodesulfobacteriota bacterium]